MSTETTTIIQPPTPGSSPSGGEPKDSTRTLMRILGFVVALLLLAVIAAAVLAMMLTGGDETDETVPTSTLTTDEPAELDSGTETDAATDVDTGTSEAPADPGASEAPVVDEAPAPDAPASDEAAADDDVPANDEGAVVVAPVALGSHALSLDGMGPILFGMSVPDAEAALGAEIVSLDTLPAECAFAVVANDPASPFIMVVSDSGDINTGTIVRIDLLAGQSTRSGISIGSSKADVLAAYGDNLVVTPHPYEFEAGSEVLTYVPTESSDYRVVMETRGDTVVAVRAGLAAAADLKEGCL